MLSIVSFFQNNWYWIKFIVIVLVLIEVVKITKRIIDYQKESARERKFKKYNIKKGKEGEKKVACELKTNKYEGSKLYNDVYLEEEGNVIAQLDHVLISPKGVFVIETKNWEGMVENRDFECIIRNKGKEYYTFQPTMQNKRHKIKLERLLEIEGVCDVTIFPKVHKIRSWNKEDKMCNIKDFYKKYYKDKDDVLSSDDIEYLADKLECVMSTNKKKNKLYVENLVKDDRKTAREFKKEFKGSPYVRY